MAVKEMDQNSGDWNSEIIDKNFANITHKSNSGRLVKFILPRKTITSLIANNKDVDSK